MPPSAQVTLGEESGSPGRRGLGSRFFAVLGRCGHSRSPRLHTMAGPTPPPTPSPQGRLSTCSPEMEIHTRLTEVLMTSSLQLSSGKTPAGQRLGSFRCFLFPSGVGYLDAYLPGPRKPPSVLIQIREGIQDWGANHSNPQGPSPGSSFRI